MSWNGNDNKDPWGRNDTPPEIDEVIKKVRQRIESILEEDLLVTLQEVDLVLKVYL